MQASLGPGGSPRFRKVHARIGVPDNLQLGPVTDATTRPPLPLHHRASLQPSSSGADSIFVLGLQLYANCKSRSQPGCVVIEH